MKRRRTLGSHKKSGIEFLAIDKKNVSIHEAGHAVVALKVGCPWVKLTLERDYSRDLTSEVAFRGQCGRGKINGKVNEAAQAYAGVIAEMLYAGFDTDHNDVWEYLDLEMWTPSTTDMESIERLSPKWRMRAIKLSLNILKANWTSVRAVAFKLHEDRDDGVVLHSFVFSDTKWLKLLWRDLL
ncbi:MAG TPA: hypothetical protein VL981_05240 [Candidatus Methylacidiphilales bacterium]|nr:hypothetical protein [Candidatus Methylacidiphilales bacterium]